MNYYKNNIRHVKGDTFSSALIVEGLGQSLESIYFTCRDSLNDDSTILFEKSLADGGISQVEYDAEHDIRKYAVRIDPFDTRTLQVGTYFYDIQITVNSDVFTIMKGKFILEQDASRKGEPSEPEIIIQIKAVLDEINGEEISVDVFDKLDYLSDTKELMKDSLNKLGSEITEETTFRGYVDKIDDLYADYPRFTEEGTDFSINTKGLMQLIPKGNTEQTTTSISDGDEYDSPTPEHPQEYRYVTGENTINVNDDEYTLNLGTLKAYEGDYFYKNNDNWHLKNLSKERILNGTEGWQMANTSTNYAYFYNTLLDSTAKPNNDKKRSYCNRFNWVYDIGVNTNVNNNNYAITSSTYNKLRFAVDKSLLSSVSANGFKSWLATNNVNLLYELVNPTDTLIEDETLIEQLDILQEVMANNGVNTISAEYEEGNAPAIISATALMKGSE